MERSEIECNLEIIFQKEINDLSKRVPTCTIEKSGELKYPNAETWMGLFGTIQNNEELKSFFVESLKKQITDAVETSTAELVDVLSGRKFHIGTSPLCFYTLVELGFVDDALDALQRRVLKPWRGIYDLLFDLIPRHYFDKYQLNKIDAIRRQDIFYFQSELKDMYSMIVDARFELVRAQVRKVNVEINQDKKTVTEKMSQFGFSDSYNELLAGIDRFINTETSNIVNAGLISDLRAFIEKLLKEVAMRIAENKCEKIPIVAPSENGNIRSYLRKELDLSEKDNKFIDSFVDILHKEGGHAFTSEKEYFRLARNIAIEIALFILSKYGKKFKS